MGLLSTNYGTGKDRMDMTRQHAEGIAHRLEENDPETCPSQAETAAAIFSLLGELEASDRIEQALQQVIAAAASVPDSDDLGGLLFVMGRIAIARDALAAFGSSVGASA